MSSPPSVSRLPSAPVWRRLAALVYDGLLLFALLLAATALYQGLSGQLHSLPDPTATEAVMEALPDGPGGLLFQGYLLAVIVGFYVYFWRRSGQTLGMQAWRLQLISAAGGRPGLGQCLLRLLVGIPALLLAGIGYGWIWLDREGRAWHDLASRTRVVMLPRRRS